MRRIRVMSYNIQGHAALGRPDHLPKLAEVIAAADPDVVGLQEVHFGTRVGPTHQGEALASLTGLSHWFGRSCAMDGGEYGNAILTRGEVKDAKTHPLPGSGEPRSMLQADLEIDGLELTFFVTHLAAWGRLLRESRMRQITLISDVTYAVARPHILAGDFNVAPAGVEIATLLSRGHLRSCGDAREATFPMTSQRLDYVFCDEPWQIVSSEVIRRGPSDHWPVIVELDLPERST
ncbi:MAG TPA: endonuclease/exonuclease/phosphatase family protein [Thermoanaerobaculia bacterium]